MSHNAIDLKVSISGCGTTIIVSASSESGRVLDDLEKLAARATLDYAHYLRKQGADSASLPVAAINDNGE